MQKNLALRFARIAVTALGLFGATPTLAISTALLIRANRFLYASIGCLLYPLVSDCHSGETVEVEINTAQ